MESLNIEWHDIPRSIKLTLLLLVAEIGRTSLSLAYPSLSSSRLRCSASILCLRVFSLREKMGAKLGSSSLVGEGISLPCI